MSRTTPPLAIPLGLGGLIPFLGCGYEAIGLRHVVSPAVALAALIAYAAAILAFLGAVHWGLALADPVARPGTATRRLVGGVLPALLAWAALLLAWPVAHPSAGLALLAAGFVVVLAAEGRATRAALLPRGYWGLRIGLTVVVVAVLLTVLVVRLGRVAIAF